VLGVTTAPRARAASQLTVSSSKSWNRRSTNSAARLWFWTRRPFVVFYHDVSQRRLDERREQLTQVQAPIACRLESTDADVLAIEVEKNESSILFRNTSNSTQYKQYYRMKCCRRTCRPLIYHRRNDVPRALAMKCSLCMMHAPVDDHSQERRHIPCYPYLKIQSARIPSWITLSSPPCVMLPELRKTGITCLLGLPKPPAVCWSERSVLTILRERAQRMARMRSPLATSAVRS
jgi:hypothetical protein